MASRLLLRRSLQSVARRTGLAAAVRPPLPLHSTFGAASFSSEAAPPPSSSSLIVQRGDEGIASVYLSAPPVNALSTPLLEEFIALLKDLDNDPTIRGFVLGSAVPNIFSAGIHLPEMLLDADGGVDNFVHFWTLLQEAWLALYTTPLASVAAIPGHCPAGGCLLAFSCDVRVMVEGKGLIGLNEAAFGLIPPPWLSRMLVGLAGQRKAEDMIMRGVMLPPEEALAAGLVDVTVPLAGLTDEANSRLASLLAVPEGSRRLAKLQLRQEAAERLRDAQSEDLDEVLQLVTQPAVQHSIRTYLESLSKKSNGGE